VTPWSHLDVVGDLHLHFVNGALFETAFFPASSAQYLSVLRDNGITPALSSASSSYTAIHIWQATAYDGRPYVAWSDRRVRSEIDSWIRACS
jgi:hypothetical protein